MFGFPRRNPETRTTTARAGETSVVAQGAVLDSWARADWTDGCQVDQLPDLQPLTVVTRNHFYEIIVVDGRTGLLRIRGGRLIREWREAVLAGCSLGGSFLKLRGIYAGFCMEIHLDGEVIITTPVQRLTLTHIEAGAHH
jgi:hypothetical protein